MDIQWERLAFGPDSAWGQCLVAFLRRLHGRSGSRSTLVHYQQVLLLFLSEPAKLPDAYSRADVEAFLHKPGTAHGRVGQEVAPGTINNRLSILRSFYHYAAGYTIDRGAGPVPLLQQMAPTAGLDHLRVPRKPHRALATDNLRRFFAAIPKDTVQGKRDRALFLTYFYTARRREEIVRLRWGDISEGVVLDGQARRKAHIYTFYGKGYSRQADSAEMPEPAYNAIVTYLQADGRLGTIAPNDPIFVTMPDYKGAKGHDPHRHLRAQSVWHLAKQYAKRAGLDPSAITVHSFRHTSARARYESGSDIREIQQLLRHQSLATTDLYLRQMITAADPGAHLLEQEFGDL